MKLDITADDVLFAALNNTVLFVDESINVTGVDSDGSRWYQLETGETLDEPYLNSYGYKVTLSECTAENHGSPIEAYKWIYRCIKQNFEVAKRTVFAYGEAHENSELIYINSDGNGVLVVPFKQFQNIEGGYAVTILKRVIADNDFIAFQYGNIDKESRLLTNFAMSLSELNGMQEDMNSSIADVDLRISNLYSFTPDNQPQTVTDRVKIAKVIFDWLRLNNRYSDSDDWKDQTAYCALSGGVSPVCSSYARAAHLLLNRYGIENIVCNGHHNGIGHVWNIVNYHDNIGEYTADATQWCMFDPTGNASGTLTSWNNFNFVYDESQGYVFDERIYPLPTINPKDGEHAYTGANHYSW